MNPMLKVALVPTLGQMERSMKDNGKTIIFMEKEYSQIHKAKQKKESGLMEKELLGWAKLYKIQSKWKHKINHQLNNTELMRQK